MHTKNLTFLFLTLLSLFSFNVYAANEFNHQSWDGLLKANVKIIHVGKSSQVDYAGIKAEHKLLKSYLQSLASVSQQTFDSWSKDNQLAFLINAYNAVTVDLILTQYPDLESIKDLGSFFQSPWSKEYAVLLGEKRSLDDIEHNLIRGSGRYNDPRIHFAVNCASIGCPALRAEAFDPARLDKQLEEATILFLSDRSRNRYENGKFYVSSIFKWYRDDFEMGWKGISTLNDFFLNYPQAFSLNKDTLLKLKANPANINFLEYDWRLNKIQ
jgi:hypothetical protein